MILNVGPSIEASHRYAFIFELLAFWQAIQARLKHGETSGDSSLLLMERNPAPVEVGSLSHLQGFVHAGFLPSTVCFAEKISTVKRMLT